MVILIDRRRINKKKRPIQNYERNSRIKHNKIQNNRFLFSK
jgi:hypothetical protein